ncbi:MAG: alpha/beta hydrolase [Deltaproteobacteria bacterium]|nr:alpha/beta hydrolase [Deltaproteobacteria bacterium]
MKRSAIAIVALALLVGLGHVSGNQPDRDALEAARQELRVPLERRFVDVGEVELHVVLAGPADGPPVVLLHGFPEFWYAWRGPLAVLARAGFRVIVPDQRGYNRSAKPSERSAYRVDRLADDVAGLIEALGYEDAFLAGHDWGGGVAWQTTLRHPERVRRLVVLDTPHPRAIEGYESQGDSIDWYRTFILLPWIPEWAARVGNWKLLSNSLRATSLPGTFPERVMDQFRTAWDREGAVSSMADWYRANTEPLPPEGDGRVSCPTLVLLAPGDLYIPSDLTRRSMRFLDAGRLHELERGTHWAIQEEPEIVGGLLAQFFSEPDEMEAP